MEQDILTVEQAAQYLQVTSRTIYSLVETNKLKASKVGRVWRIRKSDIDEYLEQNKNQT